MKIIKYDKSPVGKKTVVQITRSEAIELIAALSANLYRNQPPSRVYSLCVGKPTLTESGEFFDIEIVDKE